MNTATLELRLKALHLPGFLTHYAALAEQAGRAGWDPVHYLDELVALEAEERGEQRIARLLRAARLPRDKTLATLDSARFTGRTQPDPSLATRGVSGGGHERVPLWQSRYREDPHHGGVGV